MLYCKPEGCLVVRRTSADRPTPLRAGQAGGVDVNAGFGAGLSAGLAGSETGAIGGRCREGALPPCRDLLRDDLQVQAHGFGSGYEVARYVASSLMGLSATLQSLSATGHPALTFSTRSQTICRLIPPNLHTWAALRSPQTGSALQTS